MRFAGKKGAALLGREHQEERVNKHINVSANTLSVTRQDWVKMMVSCDHVRLLGVVHSSPKLPQAVARSISIQHNNLLETPWAVALYPDTIQNFSLHEHKYLESVCNTLCS